MILANPIYGIAKLSGIPIGTSVGFDFNTESVVTDIQSNAFDGNLNTYFASKDGSYTWVGLDLGCAHVISRIGWATANIAQDRSKMQLGIFEGANRADFMDAIPIYLISAAENAGTMNYADISCSRGFRYIRFVSPADSHCSVAELEFYGEPGKGDDLHLFQLTNLPTVYINTEDSEIPYDKEHEIVSNVIIINNNRINVNYSAGVRERGNASRTMPKKPWRIKFDKKQTVLNAPAKAKKWTLIPNYGDKTLLRNVIAFEIARRIGMEYVPYCQPVDVVMNGEYKGCYQLCDQIQVNPNRIEIEEMTADDITGEALTGGYHFEIDAYNKEEPENVRFNTRRGLPITIKSPDEDEIMDIQKNYLQNYIQRFEDLVYAQNSSERNAEFLNIFDIDSFLQYFIVNELAGNTDAFWSVNMYKDRGCDKIFTPTVWDFDIGFENDNRTYPIIKTSEFNFLSMSKESSATGNMRELAKRIIIENDFNRTRLSEIWSIARDTQNLDYASLSKFIDYWGEELEESQNLNFLRWPIMNRFVHQNPVIGGSYEAEIERVKYYLDQRLSQLDGINHMRYDPSYAKIDCLKESTPVLLNASFSNGIISVLTDTEFTVYSIDGRKVFQGRNNTGILEKGYYLITAPGFESLKIKAY